MPEVGQLKPGYHADFIVLDQDILAITPETIDQITVEETYMGGQLVYKK
ncbi:amidohydrolase family protein [Brevibacillus reuszeri]|nr:amidohydrolase family protein [Brevibacillus reuszeri]MED1855681.1 amidohydrolase family protein [Brevibacillus reuszeri]